MLIQLSSKIIRLDAIVHADLSLPDPDSDKEDWAELMIVFSSGQGTILYQAEALTVWDLLIKHCWNTNGCISRVEEVVPA